MISILIPTKNRHKYIKKLIKFYSINEFKGVIHIFDSSNDFTFKKNKNLIDSTTKIKVKLYKIKSTTLGSIALRIKLVETEYSIITGDDDYLIIDDLKKFTNEFNIDKKTIAVGGLSVLISKLQDSNSFQDINFYPLNNIKMINPLNRLLFSINNYRPNIFLIIKTKNIKKILSMIDFKDNNKNLLRTAKDELAFSYILPFLGKIKILNQNFIIRTGHGDNLKLTPLNLASEDQINYSVEYILKSLIKTSKSSKIKLLPKSIELIKKKLIMNFKKKYRDKDKKNRFTTILKNSILTFFPYFLKKFYYNQKMLFRINKLYRKKLVQNSKKLSMNINLVEDH